MDALITDRAGADGARRAGQQSRPCAAGSLEILDPGRDSKPLEQLGVGAWRTGADRRRRGSYVVLPRDVFLTPSFRSHKFDTTTLTPSLTGRHRSFS